VRTVLPRAALTTLAVATALAAIPGVALAAAPATPTRTAVTSDAGPAVFVQTNALTGNTILAYHRADDGALTPVGEYQTGGLGGVAVNAPLDSLASQGSLTYDPAHRLLFAVNAGSNSVTVFAVHGAQLLREQVVSSRGQFPVSISVHGGLLAVLNAGGSGSVAAYAIVGDRLAALPWAHRSLGLANTTPPLFITAPAEVGFSPSGHDLVVTTKANGSIDVIPVHAGGAFGPTSVTTSAGAVPFSFTFDRFAHLVVTEAGTSTVTTYALSWDGALTPLTVSVGDGGKALCWTVNARGLVIGANAGSATLSSYRTASTGGLTLVQPVATATGAGPIDMATAAHGHLLYVQDSVAGEVQGFWVHADGTLTLATTLTGLPAFNGAGMEGIAAS